MTKGAVAKEDPKNRRSFGKNQTPNKQKLQNAAVKTPNSAVKQIKTPKSGNKPQANAAAYSPGINDTGKLSRSQRRRLQKKRKKEQLIMQQGNASAKKGSPNGVTKGKDAANEDEDDEDEDDSEDLEEEEDDSDLGAEEEGSDDDDVEMVGEEEGDEEDSDEDDDDDDEEEDDDDDDSELDESKDTTAEVKEENESEDDDDEEDDDDDEDDDDEEEEEEKKTEDSNKSKPVKQAPKKEKSAAEKAADQANSIFLGNLDFKLRKEDVEKFLKEKLSPGDVKNVDFPALKAGRSRGYCFVTLANKNAVEKAMKLTDTEWHGRNIKVGPKTAENVSDRKFARITNITNMVTDGQVLELLSKTVKLNEIKSYQRVRSNVFGVHGAVQLQFLSDECYKKIQKLNDTELAGKKIEVLETMKSLKNAKDSGDKKVNPGSNQNRNKGNQNKGNFQQKGNKAGGRYFKKNDGPKKRPAGNFGGNKVNKKQKKE